LQAKYTKRVHTRFPIPSVAGWNESKYLEESYLELQKSSPVVQQKHCAADELHL